MNKTPPGKGGALVSDTGNLLASSLNPSAAQVREPFAIVVARSLWHRCTVSIEPPRREHPPRTFRDREAALGFAVELARVTGWPMRDRCDG